jgi:hypothetical protein
MKTVPRDEFLDRLQHQWQPFVSHFQSLAAPEQQAYLKRQGYDSFKDLLAHIISWWQDGAENIALMRENPALPPKDYDVDSFNAQAVARFHDRLEPEVVRTYQSQCQRMLDLVRSLPDAELYHEHINARLYYEIIMHWKEHELS